ncbi:alanine racemase [Jiangella muralis]|uniref:alanine racemase n=1 Tax=Jiangella muralis TaxID=702383 RepID=UPI00069FF66D|nr:alanine racemase [Jiangella muralis]
MTDDLRTPVLVVDAEVLDANLADMQRRCDDAGVELLPHAKTHRIAAVGLRQLAAGAAGLTVATLGEAEAFAAAGVTRILLAYPLAGEEKLRRAHELSRRVRLDLAVDGIAPAEAIGRHFHAHGAEAGVFVIVDSGMHRDGARPDEVPALAAAVSRQPGLRLRGLLTHEGSVYQVRPEQVAAASRDVVAVMAATARACAAAGVEVPAISLGASASVRSVVGAAGVDQVRPGIYAFNDLGQVALGQARVEDCAATVLATVVSHPEPGRACIDAGSKLLSRDGVPPAGAGRFPGFGLLLGVRGWTIDALSEEHGWLRWNGAGDPDPLDVGTRVSIVPNHICTVFAHVDSVVVHAAGRPREEWPTLPRSVSR